MDKACSMNLDKGRGERKRRRRMHIGLFVGKTAVNISLGRPHCRWMDNMKMDLR
jgi:hypothetical protein